MTPPLCRFCRTPLVDTFLDLGRQPLANSYLTAAQLAAGTERSYPLHVRVCRACFLVQADDAVPAGEIFDDGYAYFSSYSTSWVEHARRYAFGHLVRFDMDNRGHDLGRRRKRAAVHFHRQLGPAAPLRQDR